MYTSGIYMISGYMMGYMCLKCIQRGMYLKCKIHAGYMWDKCILRGNQDTCWIHQGIGVFFDTRKGQFRYKISLYKRHAGYMRDTWQDTCILRGNHDTYGIHQRFMGIADTCGIHAGYVYLGCQGEWVSMSSSCAAHLSGALSGHPLPPWPCVQMGLLHSPLELPHIICFVMATLIPEAGLPPCDLGRGRSAPRFPALDVYECIPMYPICISLVSWM